MMKWKKIALLTAPLLIGGTVYALAADGATTEQAAATTSASGVSYKVVKAEPLSTDELQALQQAKVTPVSTAGQATAQVDPLDPFVMYKGDTAPASSAPATSNTAPAAGMPTPAPAPATPNQQFDLASVKNFEWTTMTSQGELKLEFKNEHGEIKLEGKLNGREIEVEGDKALALLSGLMQNAHLNDALTATIQGKQASLDASVVSALQGLRVELQDGRKIEAKPKGNPKGNPKAQGLHDNGNHYGQEKAKKEKEKEKEPHGKGKHGNDD